MQYPSHLHTEITDFITLKNLIVDEMEKNNTLAEMDKIQLGQLRTWAEESHGKPKVQAQNILCFFYEECYYKKPPEPVFGNKMLVTGEDSDAKEIENKKGLKCYPNPGSDWVSIEALEASWEEASVLITDISGKTIQRFTLKNRQYIWDTRNVPSGVYLIKVTSAERTTTLKVTVRH